MILKFKKSQHIGAIIGNYKITERLGIQLVKRRNAFSGIKNRLKFYYNAKLV